MTSIADQFYRAYFVLHIAITACVDAAIAIPKQYQFEFQKQMLQLHIDQNADPLVQNAPVWLKSFVWVEISSQLPFFFWAAYDLSTKNKRVWPAIVAYGTVASTTTLACLAEIAFMNTSPSVKFQLFAIYFPTFVIPLVMAGDFGIRIAKALGAKHKIE